MDTCNEYLIISLIITSITIIGSSCAVCYYKKKLNERKDTYTEFYNNHTFQI